MKSKGKVLVIDDNEDVLITSKVVLRHHFEGVFTLTHPNLVPQLDDFSSFDVVLLDMNFRQGATSGKEGMLALKDLLVLNPEAHIIMMTAFGDIHLAVRAMKEGAIDFIVKPWDNERFLATVNSVYKLKCSRRKVKELESKTKNLNYVLNQKSDQLIGSSTAMNELHRIINKVADTEANILLLGENGTGKELVAREIHKLSHRRNEAFIPVDLGAIPHSLFEAELFGYTKGAFTDASEDKAGRLEMAEKGTLFLDEIGNMDIGLQAKLLSVLQNRQVVRLGSNKPIPLDIRLICATNMPLHKMAEERSFREDLLYRINTVELKLPPLRERIADIEELCTYFIKLYASKYQRNIKAIEPNAMKSLKAYNWPGNIRELQHLIERAIIMSESEMLAKEDFMLRELREENLPQVLNLEQLEKNAITLAIQKHDGNLSKAAKELGLGRTTLYRKMEKYGL